MFIPDPDLDFLPIPDPGSREKTRHGIPGVKKAPDPRSGSATLYYEGWYWYRYCTA
jgi:hypothetical protein